MPQFSICGADWIAAKTQEFIAPYNEKLASPARFFEVIAIPWAAYREELTRMAVYSRGVDIAQVGARLANDLQAMNALRPFTRSEIEMLGGEASFTATAWNQTNRVVGDQVWSLPWLVDPRGFLYWRDMLEDAGVDEATAFQDFEHTEETLKRLKASGIETPIALPIGNSNLSGQVSCSWVWKAGGEFISADGNKPLFMEQPFFDGLQAYFRLEPYLYHKDGVLQMLDDANGLFVNRQAAVLYGGMWPITEIIANASHPFRSRLGLSLPPGPPVSTGSNLIIWNFSCYESETVGLVKYLLGQDAQREYPLLVNHLPAHADVIAKPPYSDDPILAGFVKMANASRTFLNISLCGLLEGAYNTSVQQIWSKIAAQPGVEVQPLIYQELRVLERRFRGWVTS